MGNLTSRINEEPDISSSEESEDNFEMNQQKGLFSENTSTTATSSNLQLDTDAINPHLTSTRGLNFTSITLASIQDMEKHLDVYEKVSLIFLLSENLQDCINIVSLYKWTKNEIKIGNNWRAKVVEALAIIQNYQILIKYGFTKDELTKEFFPLQYFTSKYISRFKKTIYCICEKMTAEDEVLFLKSIESDMSKCDFKFNRYPFMEMNFSYLLQIGYISETNVKNILQILKIMEYEHLYEMLRMINPAEQSSETSDPKIMDGNLEKKLFITTQEKTNITSVSRGDTSLLRNISNATQDHTQGLRHSSGNNFSRNVSKNSEDIYDTNSDKIAFIIDQENFYTETNPEYKDLLPENAVNEKLHSRTGTSFDSEKLEHTLKKRNFIVKLERNLTHLKMMSELKATVKAIDEKNCSCFLVSILSHGDDGVIYGCNSCQVEVSSIIEIMSHIKLDKIPKLLILQSCQGPNLQETRRMYDNLEVDGPSVKVQPSIKVPDFLIFWATVPGFSAIRDRNSGTWFIQSLCNQLETADDQVHFEDICTKIIREVSNKKCQKKNTEFYMVPYKNSTLTKNLYL